MTIGISPCRPSRFAVQHKSQEPLNFCFAGHLLKKHSREPDGFLGEATAALIRARHIVPTNAERGVNGLQHRIQPRWQLLLLGHFKPDASVADLRLRSDKPLPHGFRRNQESTSDADSIEA